MRTRWKPLLCVRTFWNSEKRGSLGCESKRKRNFPWRTTPSTRLQHQPITSLGKPFEPTCNCRTKLFQNFKMSTLVRSRTGICAVLRTCFARDAVPHKFNLLPLVCTHFYLCYFVLFRFLFLPALWCSGFQAFQGNKRCILYVEESIISYKERDARISCVFILPSEFIEFVVTAEWN